MKLPSQITITPNLALTVEPVPNKSHIKLTLTDDGEHVITTTAKLITNTRHRAFYKMLGSHLFYSDAVVRASLIEHIGLRTLGLYPMPKLVDTLLCRIADLLEQHAQNNEEMHPDYIPF